MDAHELFWQLTRGVHFSKKKSKTNLKAKENDKENLKVKMEETESATMEYEEIENADDFMDEDFDGNSSCFGADESEDEEKEEGTEDVKIKDNQDEEDEEETVLEYLKGPLHLNKEELEKKKKKNKKKTVLSEEDRQKRLHAEMITTLRKENRITVLGKNIPDPIQNFEDLEHEANGYKVMSRLIKNLALCNYPKPTPVQMQAIPIMLKGRHLMACAPTGSGKTIAFLTPILNDLKAPKKIGFRALILAPTRELAQQIYRECIRLAEKTALKIHLIKNTNQVAEKFGPNSAKKCDILISTPNRIRYLLQQEPPALDLKSVEWLVIDEADRLMDESQDNFKEQLDDIMAACSNTNKKMALFSATYTVPVSKWIVKHLKNVIRLTVGQQNSATETVEQELLFVGSESGKLLAIRDMVRTGLKPPVLVFVQSKDRAKQLFTELLYDGINVDVIHADRTQQQRDNCVKAFREGHIWVLICTELMGRGIDFKGVNLVINYDFPPSTISYIHRIGRTGRAGRSGKAITYYTQDDKPNLRKIAEIIKNSGGKVPDFLLTMKKPRKSEIKNYQNHAPKREDISTKIKPEGGHTKDEKLVSVNKLIRKKEKQSKKESYEMDKLQKKKKNLLKFNQKVQTKPNHLKKKRKPSLNK